MDQNGPEEELSFHERKIKVLEQQRRYPGPRPGPKPPGAPPNKALTPTDLEFNQAIDRQITFWQKQVEITPEHEGKARRSFTRSTRGYER